MSRTLLPALSPHFLCPSPPPVPSDPTPASRPPHAPPPPRPCSDSSVQRSLTAQIENKIEMLVRRGVEGALTLALMLAWEMGGGAPTLIL